MWQLRQTAEKKRVPLTSPYGTAQTINAESTAVEVLCAVVSSQIGEVSCGGQPSPGKQNCCQAPESWCLVVLIAALGHFASRLWKAEQLSPELWCSVVLIAALGHFVSSLCSL